MSPEAALFLEKEVYPAIQRAVPRVVRPLDGEDSRELVQDVAASAAQMLDAAEKKGKLPPAKSLVYYSINRAKVGRRSYPCKAGDIMSSERRLTHPGSVLSLDADVEVDDGDGERVPFADLVADRKDSPSENVMKKLDWDGLFPQLCEKSLLVLNATAEGFKPSELADKLKISRGRITQIKREIGNAVKTFMGEDILEECVKEPSWRKAIRNSHERNGWQVWKIAEVEDIYA
jgi:hypothetical protein